MMTDIRHDEEALLELITYIKEGNDVTKININELYYALVRYIFDSSEKNIIIDMGNLNIQLFRDTISEILPSILHDFNMGGYQIYTVDSIKQVFVNTNQWMEEMPCLKIRAVNNKIYLDHINYPHTGQGSNRSRSFHKGTIRAIP